MWPFRKKDEYCFKIYPYKGWHKFKHKIRMLFRTRKQRLNDKEAVHEFMKGLWDKGCFDYLFKNK